MKGFAKITRGAISVLMCVLLTPFLTIAGLLIELYRYQASLETLQEVVDVSTYSTLSDYDEYLYKRFGLVAYSQDKDAQQEFRAILTRNQCILGKNITIGEAIAMPTLPLTHTTGNSMLIMKNQLKDYCESTVMAELLSNTFKIEELLGKLNGNNTLTEMGNALDGMADISDAVKNIVLHADSLKKRLESDIPNRIKSIKSKAESLQHQFYSLYQTILQDDLKSQVDEENGVSYELVIAKQCAEKLLDIYKGYFALRDEVDALITDVESIIEDVSSIKTEIGNLQTSLEQVSKSINNIKNGTGKEDAEPNNQAGDIFQEVADDLKKAFDTAENDLKKAIEDSFKIATEAFKGEIQEKFPILKGIDKNYYNPPEGEPLSEQALEDLQYIIQELPESWTTEEAEKAFDAIGKTYIPSVVGSSLENLSVSGIWNTLSGAVEKARGLFSETAKNSILKVLEALVNTLMSMFSMKGLFDERLNAFLSSDALKGLTLDPNNPHQTLLESIQTLFSSIDDFKEGIGGNWLKIGEAVVKFCKAGGQLMYSIGQSIVQIFKRLGSLVSGGLDGLYMDALFAAYMSYNLPNRTNAGNIKFNLENGFTETIELEGNGITGFKYSDIVGPSTSRTDNLPSGLAALAKFVEGASGNAKDMMFKGAEQEYIIAGTESEILNQVIVFLDIMLVRLIANLGTIFTDTNVSSIAASATIASWVVYLLYIILEPMVDTFLIVNGGKVPMFKKSCYLTPGGIDNLIEAVPDEVNGFKAILKEATGGIGGLNGNKALPIGDEDTAMDYSTYSMLLTMITLTNEQVVTRFSHIVHLEAASYYGKEYGFHIDKAYTAIEVTIPIKLNSMLSILDVGGILSVDIKRERGY